MNQKVKENLLNNWGERAESMACFAECRYYDDQTDWSCYLLALNPQDEDEILCIVDGHGVELIRWSLKEVCSKYNCVGEYVTFDKHYIRQRSAELFKKLNERKPSWTQREYELYEQQWD